MNEMNSCEQPGKIGITLLASGSAGNATLIQYGNDAIMIDAGISLREFQTRLAKSHQNPRLHGILVTHEHSDHIKGLRVIANHFNVPVFASPLCAQTLQSADPKLENLRIFAPGGEFNLDGFTVCPFSIEHDAVEPVAYSVKRDGRKIGIATDLGRVTKMVEYQLRECDALVLECNHDKKMLAESSRPWNLKTRILGPGGHLSNDQFTALLETVVNPRTKAIILAHVSRDCNTYDLAYQVAQNKLCALHRNDITLSVAHQETPTPTFWV